jgi:hypothetical protein
MPGNVGSLLMKIKLVSVGAEHGFVALLEGGGYPGGRIITKP